MALQMRSAMIKLMACVLVMWLIIATAANAEQPSRRLFGHGASTALGQFSVVGEPTGAELGGEAVLTGTLADRKLLAKPDTSAKKPIPPKNPFSSAKAAPAADGDRRLQ